MPTAVTDPAILAKLKAATPAPTSNVVTDPALLEKLHGDNYAHPDDVVAAGNGPQFPADAQGNIVGAAGSMAQAPGPNGPPVEPQKPIGQLLGEASDNLSAGFTAGVNAIPIVGPGLLSLAEQGKAMVQGRTPGDVAATDKAQEQSHPVAAGVGAVAGTVLPFAIGGAVPGVARALGMSGGLGSRIALGGLTGGAINAGDTAVRGGSPMDTLKAGVIGGGLGALVPLGGKLIGGMLGNSASKDVANVARAVGDDSIDPATINARLQAMGPDAMVMDLGPNLQRQAGAIATVPGAGQTTVRKAVGARVAGNSDRVANDIAQTVGTGPDFVTLQKQVIDAQKAAAKPLYDKVRDIPVDLNQGGFGFVFKTDLGKQALKDAQKIAQTEGYPGFVPMNVGDKMGLEWSWNRSPEKGMAAVKFGDNVYAAKTHQEAMQKAIEAEGNGIRAELNAHPDQHLGYAVGPTIGLVDYAKQALDDMATTAIRAGNNNKARAIGNLTKALTAEADQVAPGYAVARQSFAGHAAVLDAMDVGHEVFDKSMSPTQLASQMTAMSPSERDAMLLSVQSKIESIMGTAVNEPLALRNLLKQNWNEQKLRLLVGDSVTDDLLSRIDRQVRFGSTAEAVSGGSKTAATLAAQHEVSPAFQNIAPPQTTMGFVLAALNKARAMVRGAAQPKVNAGMADMLTANSLSPEQVGQITAAGKAQRPGLIGPAVPALGLSRQQGALTGGAQPEGIVLNKSSGQWNPIMSLGDWATQQGMQP